MVERIKPERLNLEAELVNLLRWEDDGGKITDIKYTMSDRQFVRPVRINAGRHDPSLQWNEHFVIGPFQAGTRIDFIKRKTPTTTIIIMAHPMHARVKAHHQCSHL